MKPHRDEKYKAATYVTGKGGKKGLSVALFSICLHYYFMFEEENPVVFFALWHFG